MSSESKKASWRRGGSLSDLTGISNFLQVTCKAIKDFPFTSTKEMLMGGKKYLELTETLQKGNFQFLSACSSTYIMFIFIFIVLLSYHL